MVKLRHSTNSYQYDPQLDEYRNENSKIKMDTTKHGKLFLHNNLIYEGNFKNMVPHGDGKFINVDGSFYVGKFKDGQKHGKGTLYGLDGKKDMEGTWDNDKRKGKFKHFDKNGKFKEFFRFENDTFVECPDGKVLNPLTGNCVKKPPVLSENTNVVMDGYKRIEFLRPRYGTIHIGQNKIYEGDIKNLKPHGKGIEYLIGYTYYKGPFKDGKKHGKGELYRSNDVLYMSGTWKNDKKEGKIKRYDHDNQPPSIVPYHNDAIVICGKDKMINYKTGNCVKKPQTFPRKLLKKINSSFFGMDHDKIEQNFFDLGETSNPVEVLMDFFSHFPVVIHPRIKKDHDNQSILLHEMMVDEPGDVLYYDLDNLARKFKFWIIFQVKKNGKSYWLEPPAYFEDYTPKAIIFIHHNQDTGEYKLLFPTHPSEFQLPKPLFLSVADLYKQPFFVLQQLSSSTTSSTSSKSTSSKSTSSKSTSSKSTSSKSTTSSTSSTSSTLSTTIEENKNLYDTMRSTFFQNPWGTEEQNVTETERLIFRELQRVTGQRLLEEKLKELVHEHNCWIFLYYNENNVKFVVNLEKKPKHIYFIKKKNPFHRNDPKGEFQKVCSVSNVSYPPVFEKYISQCSKKVMVGRGLIKKIKETPKTSSAMKRLNKILKKKRK